MRDEKKPKKKKAKKAQTPVLYSGTDPDRPPYWRYERVRYLLAKEADNQTFIDGFDDAATRFFFTVCQQLGRAKTPEERIVLRQKNPGVLEAMQLRKHTSLDALGLLEGFLCTSANLGWVSDRFSLTPATVAWYEQLFFDVWSRREATFWVERAAIKPPSYPGHELAKSNNASGLFTDYESRQHWERACSYRKFGYHGGPVALELFSTGFLSTDAKPTYRELADTFIKKSLEASVSNEGLAMMQAKRKLNKTEGEFIKMALDLAERALLAGSLDVVQGVQKALALVSPLVGEDVKAELEKFAAQDADRAAILVGAAELRSAESARLHLGLGLSPEARSLVDSYNESRNIAD